MKNLFSLLIVFLCHSASGMEAAHAAKEDIAILAAEKALEYKKWFVDDGKKYCLGMMDFAIEQNFSNLYERMQAELSELPDKKLVAPFVKAAERGRCTMLLLTLTARKNIIDLQNTECNALIYAAYFGHKDAVALLLHNKANPNIVSENAPHWTALAAAMCSQHDAIVALLLNRGANANGPGIKTKAGFSFETVLGWASATPRVVNYIPLLLKAGADPNRACSNGTTPLMLASAFNCAAAIPSLLAGKADPNRTNKFQETALAIAASGGYFECVSALLEGIKNEEMRGYLKPLHDDPQTFLSLCPLDVVGLMGLYCNVKANPNTKIKNKNARDIALAACAVQKDPEKKKNYKKVIALLESREVIDHPLEAGWQKVNEEGGL